MKKDTSTIIKSHQFEDSKIGVRLPIVINLVLAVFFLIFNRNSPYLYYCLASGLFLFVIHLLYDWKIPVLNLLAIMIYLAIFFTELIWEGMPNQALNPDEELAKGIFMDLSLFIIPFIYVGVRLLALIPLIRVLWLSNQLNKHNKAAF